MCPKCEGFCIRHPLFYDPEVRDFFHSNTGVSPSNQIECAFVENLEFNKENVGCRTIKAVIDKYYNSIITSGNSCALTVGIGLGEFLFLTWSNKSKTISDSMVIMEHGEWRVSTLRDYEIALTIKKGKKCKV